MELKQGTLLQGGEFKIIKKLGQGGFGITYLAYQNSLDRNVAIKEFFMKDYCHRSEESTVVSVPTSGNVELVGKYKERFKREAKLTSKLSHPHIVTIYSIFEENDTVYYVMEYLPGGSLSEYAKNRALSGREAVKFTLQVGEALKEMHAQKENHLDVKPGNIILRNPNNAVLIDFGLTKMFDENGKPMTTTTSSTVGYTPGYAPIEQLDGVKDFQPTLDVYSLGATLYRLVVGSVPPTATNIFQDGLPELPNTLSAGVKNAIVKAMQPHHKDRPQTIDDFCKLLSDNDVTSSSDDEVTTAADSEETRLTGGDVPGGGTKIDIPKSPPPPPISPPPPEAEGNILWKWVLVAVVCLIPCFLLIKNCKGTEEAPTEETVPDEEAVFVGGRGELNGHEWVDLGLSVKWATCNVGASSPSDFGGYYAWGETTEKSSYTGENSRTYGDSSIGDIGGHPQYDVARAAWGSGWRLPTKQEFEELIEKCVWKWTSQGGQNGYRVTGPNGNSIFLPAAGWRGGSERDRVGYYGGYWSSSPSESYSNLACYLYFGSDGRSVDWYYRGGGRSVRPVSE